MGDRQRANPPGRFHRRGKGKGGGEIEGEAQDERELRTPNRVLNFASISFDAGATAKGTFKRGSNKGGSKGE